MAVQILSDLHLENPKGYDLFEIVPKAPYLALLGDIGNVVKHKDEYLTFLTSQLKQFRAVFLVLGNHEAYHSTWRKTLNILRAFEKEVKNDKSLGDFVVLDRATYRIPDTNVAILGCSLFSDVPNKSYRAVGIGLNDFLTIDDWNVDAHNEAHARDLTWLNEQVTELEGSGVRIMIFTHWSPSEDARAVDPRHAGSLIGSAFATDLSEESCFQSKQVKVWAFGHTHYNCDFTVQRKEDAGSLRLLANQRGYYFAQSGGYDGGKTVEVT